ncbi:MAG: hypothetical protein M3R12_04920 [Actinomycetota bacterium]|nr:hypothetical protein [Actinomycetota bacterium]
MKLKALLLALFTAGFAVSIAVAASPATVEKGKPTASTSTDGTSTDGTATSASKGKGQAKKAERCKPSRKIVVTGEFVSAGAGGFAMKVAGGNKPAKPWKGKQATVLVDEKTRFNGKKRKLADLAAGDRVLVQGYACKADAAAGSLLARKVTSKSAKAAKDDDDDDETTTTTTAVTTTTP